MRRLIALPQLHPAGGPDVVWVNPDYVVRVQDGDWEGLLVFLVDGTSVLTSLTFEALMAAVRDCYDGPS